MSEAIVLLTPVLMFFIVALFGFVGCGENLPYTDNPEPDPEPDPDPKPKDPYNPAGPLTPPSGPYLPAPKSYHDLVINTDGFAALWPLNETLGKFAIVVGGLSPSANGTYTHPNGGDPSLGSYALGKAGVLFANDPTDFAVEFTGTEAFIEVPFHAQLNPGPTVLGFTIELWVKPNPNAGAGRGVLVSSHHFESATKEQGYEIGLLKVAGQAHHQIYARVHSGTGALTTEINIQPVDGDPSEWRHIVFRYGLVAGTGYTIHLRAQLLKGVKLEDSTTTLSYENVTSAKPSTLRFAGSHPPAPGGGVALFAGTLDNIAFYNAFVPDPVLDDHFNKA